MSLRLRLLLLMLAVYAAGGYFITRWIIDQVRPRYLESMEESLVDASVLFAAVVEQHSTDRLDPTVLRQAYAEAAQRRLTARIFSLEKTSIDLLVYVTDAHGRVVFDSTGQDEGKDFSRWNDVARTLRGGYGARSTHAFPHDEETQVIYVAAPVRHGGKIIGVVSVGKPTRGINALVAQAKRRIIFGAATGGAVLLALLLLSAAWVIAPLERLTQYARAVRDGRAAKSPTLPGRTLRELGTAFEEMRDALEGRQHAERYTQALAHEVKAPLAAIRGAAELMQEEMPAESRARFLANIRNESARIQRIVERLLELSSIEARKSLATTGTIEVAGLLAEAAEGVQAAFGAAEVRLRVAPAEALRCHGDRFLLRQALGNLLQNALEFSPRGAVVGLAARAERNGVLLVVEDEGTGIPDYALPRVFERFYSLPRPGGTQKSTGIGLALVREIAHLHGGEAALENRAEGGARATLWVPSRS
jgi:two-component system, OmpR family, sensor histidine kinase CreC